MKIIIGSLLFLLYSCASTAQEVQQQKSSSSTPLDSVEIVMGANQLLANHLSKIAGKNVAYIVNHTSMVNNTHLIDTLISLGHTPVKIFAPEHGFRGKADAGEHVKDGKDVQTGVPIISLYGQHKKPTPADLKSVDLVVFDIQDVGARFYTYISTMSYVMEACAENNIPFMVLDRPNPNGHYVDGPVLESNCSSFIGLHKIPIVHGMTVGEYARMVNGEGWLKNGLQCQLTVIPCIGYSHSTSYELPIKPSPNLPNQSSIYLYPSICFFEATPVSVGRGTTKQFQILGFPNNPNGTYSFTPISMDGAKYPKHENKTCKGYDLSLKGKNKPNQLDLSYITQLYLDYPDKSAFFKKHFYKLAGNYTLQKQIESGLSEIDIRKSWEPALSEYKKMRMQYLLYSE